MSENVLLSLKDYTKSSTKRFNFFVLSHHSFCAGAAPGEHFADKKGGGQFFAILCGRLLCAAPNDNSKIKLFVFE